jgi:hypothetical protein
LAETEQNLDAAIKLYEVNTRISEAFYTPLQCLEICFRNTIHREMSGVYGEDWLTVHAAHLLPDSRRMIGEAVSQLGIIGRPVTPGRVVAELKFAFWVGLLRRHYDASIWRTAIYRVFLPGDGKRRDFVHGRFNVIRRFRNRVAHHEPIFKRDMANIHSEIIEAIGWMCKDTAAWAAHNSWVPAVIAEAHGMLR